MLLTTSPGTPTRLCGHGPASVSANRQNGASPAALDTSTKGGAEGPDSVSELDDLVAYLFSLRSEY